jgi:hypothetical protein
MHPRRNAGSRAPEPRQASHSSARDNREVDGGVRRVVSLRPSHRGSARAEEEDHSMGILIVVLVVLAIIALLVFIFGRRR